MQPKLRWKGFLSGLALGVVIATVGASIAGMPKKQWDKNGPQFQLGYLIGFYDAASMARNSDPDGFFDRTYPVFKDLSWYRFVDEVNAMWAEPRNEKADAVRVVALTAIKLGKTEETVDHMDRFKAFWADRKERALRMQAQKERRAAEGGEAASGEDGKAEKADGAKPGDGAKAATAGDAAPKAAKKASGSEGEDARPADGKESKAKSE